MQQSYKMLCFFYLQTTDWGLRLKERDNCLMPPRVDIIFELTVFQTTASKAS